MDGFDIISYMSGMTGFLVDKDVLLGIAQERGVAGVTSFDALTTQQKDLLRADILYRVWIGPTTSASAKHSHGSYSKAYGAQNITEKDKERIYGVFMAIYGKYDDPMLEVIDGGGVSFMKFDE